MRNLKTFLLLFVVVLMLSSTLFAGEKGKVFMGLYIDDVSSSYYQKIGMKENYGVLITKVVADAPADKAGLTAKDILMEIDGDKIYTHEQLNKMLKNFEPNQKVKLKLFRDGKVKTIKFTFGKKEVPKIKKKAYMGVFLREISSKDRKKSDYEKSYGIVITDLVEDGAAEKAGIKDGAILMELGGDKIYTIDQLTKMLTNYEPENKIEVKIFQDEKEVVLDLILGEKANYTSQSWNLGDFSVQFEKPENVFVYQYTSDNDKWIGVMLHIVENKKNDNTEITVTIDEVIEDTPAEKAGLKAGDIILAVNGEEIQSKKSVSEIINKKEAGDTVDIKIDRKGKISTMKCEVAKRKSSERYEKMELSLDDGEISVWVDGEKRNLKDLDIITGKMQEAGLLYKEEVEKTMEKAKQEMQNLKGLDLENLEDLEIHFGQSGAI
ncbi:MAG: PDZ domain-containing protein [Candidatus Cloacimonadales bacterium]|nr:PDZ domain-containing protein [Candidatus Cloacimonadales bacterium]